MRQVYLDTQQYRYLVDPPTTSTIGIGLPVLRRAIARGSVEIVGSLVNLQEMVELALPNPTLYAANRNLFFELAGPRILQALDRRHVREAVSGGPLDIADRYLDEATREAMVSGASNDGALLLVYGDVVANKDRYSQSEEAACVKIRKEIEASGARPTLPMFEHWFADFDVETFNRDVVDAGVSKGLYQAEASPASFDRYPSSWMFTAARLARMVLTTGEGQRIEKSDLDDSHHASAGPYIDILVTDDKRFRRSLGLITGLPFAVMTSVEFAARFG